EYLGRADDQVKIRGFRIELGEIETVLVGHPGVREAVVVAHQGTDGHRRLVAYVATTDPVPTAELRAHLAASLPDYMVPAVFVSLEALPLTPSGKVDRRSLPEPEFRSEQTATSYTAPRDATEQLLTEVWSEVLGVEKVGIHDNFFDLGGDSILSIQVVSRARQAGLHLTSKLLFVHQSVAELAAAAAPVEAEPATGTPTGPVRGAVGLTPIQRWFFDGHAEPDHYAMSVHLELAPDTDPGMLGEALAALVAHHDALRMRFSRGDDTWLQEYGERLPTASDLLTVRDLPTADPEAAEGAALAAQRGLDLATGSLVKGVFFRFADGAAPRLFLAVHHLVTDGVSWRILLEDLERVYGDLRAGRAADLGPRTSSYQQWSARLAEHVRAGALDHELPYWAKVSGGAGLPVEHTVDVVPTYGRIAVRSVVLDRAATEALLQRVPAAHRTRINDVLLAALGRVLAERAGAPVTVALEGHGREELFADVDLSRTVGWFTTIHPVTLDVPTEGDWGPALRGVKKALRKLPGRGLGHGALRHLSAPDSEARTRLAAAPEPSISFNYLGQWGTTEAGTGLVRGRLDALGADQAPEGVRPYAVDIVAAVSDGELRLDWMHDPDLHGPGTVGDLAEAHLAALRQIIASVTD
ncbi:condensation domain-containing protein, partial [Streptomyces sp. NPDC097619]|uniref:condensation domain-containing protein n=1 Tax=Streptomyces sp. NPDC097619 TaxID=3157228 RepID=UPI00331DBBE7